MPNLCYGIAQASCLEFRVANNLTYRPVKSNEKTAKNRKEQQKGNPRKPFANKDFRGYTMTIEEPQRSAKLYN